MFNRMSFGCCSTRKNSKRLTSTEILNEFCHYGYLLSICIIHILDQFAERHFEGINLKT